MVSMYLYLGPILIKVQQFMVNGLKSRELPDPTTLERGRDYGILPSCEDGIWYWY